MSKKHIFFAVGTLCLCLFAGCGANMEDDTLSSKKQEITSLENVDGEFSKENGSFNNDEISSALNAEEKQKLLALQFEDYRHMTISEFQNKVWEMTDTLEYRELLGRLSNDETLYALRDGDETAAFLFYVLEPLTAEKWQSWTYSGSATSSHFPWEDKAILEYTYTLTILNTDIMVKDYCDIRLAVEDFLGDILYNRTKEELQNKTFMLTEIKNYVDEMVSYMQTPEVGIAIEYAYFPLSADEDNRKDAGVSAGKESLFEEDTEKRRYENGTERDYRSLLALKTPDYQDMSLADFNAALLEWANEDYDRMERISEDVAFKDFEVSLSNDELSFVQLTTFLSGMENAKYVQSEFTGKAEENPGCDQYFPQKTIADSGMGAWCSLYYQFTYHVSDKKVVTVAERDSQIQAMIDGVQNFWNGTDTEELLKMNERDVTKRMIEIAEDNSNNHIIISVNNVHFEKMDER